MASETSTQYCAPLLTAASCYLALWAGGDWLVAQACANTGMMQKLEAPLRPVLLFLPFPHFWFLKRGVLPAVTPMVHTPVVPRLTQSTAPTTHLLLEPS